MFLTINENLLLNTFDIFYILETPTNNTILITTFNKNFTINKKYYDLIKNKLNTLNNFFYISDYGFFNLSKIISISFNEKNKNYIFNYLNVNNNIIISAKKIETLPPDFFQKLMDWSEDNGGGGGGSGDDFEYSNSTPIPKELGGYPKGTTFTNKTSKEMWDGLLYPYIAPSVTVLSTLKTQLEIGDTLTSPLSVTWDTSEQSKITNTAIYFDNKLLEENLNASGTKSFAITPVQLTAQGSKTIKCEITDEKSSKYSKTTNINWVNLYYLRNSTKETLTEDDVKTFNKFNGNGISSEFTIDGSGYKYICYPKAWGIFKYMDKDSKFDISMKDPEVINLTNDFGVMQEFYIHRTSQSIGGSLTFVKQ